MLDNQTCLNWTTYGRSLLKEMEYFYKNKLKQMECDYVIMFHR